MKQKKLAWVDNIVRVKWSHFTAHVLENADYGFTGSLGYVTNEVICSASSPISLAVIKD